MAHDDLQFLDINSPDIQVIDPNRQSRMDWRKGKKPTPKFGWQLRPIILVSLAVISAVTGWVVSRPPMDEGLPQMALGTWFTWEDKYLGQGFTLGKGSLTFHLGKDYQVNHAINRVDRRTQDGFEYYDLYANLTDEWPTFSLARVGDRLILPNQREIRWLKGEIPDPGE